MKISNSTFKMSAQDKRILATLDGEPRAAYRRAAVEAQVIFDENKRKSLKSRPRDSGEE